MGSNITINLNGHQIFGEGGLAVEHQAAGVRVAGQSNVVVTNGLRPLEVGRQDDVLQLELLENQAQLVDAVDRPVQLGADLGPPVF